MRIDHADARASVAQALTFDQVKRQHPVASLSSSPGKQAEQLAQRSAACALATSSAMSWYIGISRRAASALSQRRSSIRTLMDVKLNHASG
jgi:hypothetical protein